MNIYAGWGFKGSPFETTPLPADRKGVSLMVGREKVARKIIKGLKSSNKFVTVEGLNGVGKTSVINVSVFQAAAEQITNGDGPLFIPCRKPFQLRPDVPAVEFKKEVLFEVAQTLIEARDKLPIPKGHIKSPNNPKLNRWLNSIEPAAGGFSTPIGGVNYSGVPNQSEGFSESGFEKSVVDWLKLIFPNSAEGGMVCIIDNLELLQTSKAAREQIESMRDDVMQIPGMRWVLCGALGIVQGVASSPRMAGYLQNSISIDDLEVSHAREIFRKRIEFFHLRQDHSLPLTEENFEYLFRVLRGNLRAVLSECENFCMHVSDLHDDDEAVPNDVFALWFESEIKHAYESSIEFLGKRAMEVFEVACDKEAFSPSEFEDFGCTSGEALRPHVKDLETAGLLVSTQDEADKRRRTVQVVPKGWKVREYLIRSDENRTD